MLKILTYLASFLMGRLQATMKPSYLIVIDQLLVRARKMMMTSVLSLVAGLLLTGGVIISLVEFTSQIDKFGVVWPSATLIGGLILTALSIGALVYSFTSKSFDLRYVSPSVVKRHGHSVFGEQMDQNVNPTPRQPSPLEEALGVLVMDFVNERRETRLREQSEAKTSEAPYVAPQASTESPRSNYENTTLQ